MTVRAVAAIAGVGVLEEQGDQWIATELVGERPGCGLVQPHQWGFEDEAALHAETVAVDA